MELTRDTSRPNVSALAAQLRAARISLGMSQDRVALAVGIEQSTLSKIERGTLTPSSPLLMRLRKTLGLPNADS